MQLNSQETLPVKLEQAWEALNDISLLQAAIPGCESIMPNGEHQFDVAIMAIVGPVKARFKGKLLLENMQPPNSYTLRFEGQGGAAGHGKGSADIRLESKGPAETLLLYSAQASVGGKMAQIGSRLVDMAAQKMAAEFFATFNTALQQRYGVTVAAPEVAAPPTAGGLMSRFLAWLKRLFGG